ncbi:hypothetical protein IFM89_032999 [Coptis chinensis]|uniref:Uncharacterized protein n=1 Tax=Coptis chinensis TaxID=261450 RepID=A0A835M7U0_9MAGN|nr:hypothetical protein IFM89_032999 [Coptis chinensis]
MCIGALDVSPSFPLCRRVSKKSRIRVHRLTRWRRRSCNGEMMVMGTELELKNLKLYLENRNIMEENAKLREKASLLHQENQVLMLELQNKKFSHVV